MWGIVPAAGIGSRMRPLAFSKELLPVGSRQEGGRERPRAVSEYLLERMLLAGVRRICMVISPGKPDLLEYYRGSYADAAICYVMQNAPVGLCDAIFQALPLVRPDEQILVGLPDTLWFPEDGFVELADDALSLLCFPVERPELFDAVLVDNRGRVTHVQVKDPDAESRWIWGAIKMNGRIMQELYALWMLRDRVDVYLGTLLNAHIQRGGEVRAVRRGELYVDVGTIRGYHEAVTLLTAGKRPPEEPRPTAS